MEDMKKILVTGGSGFIGSNFIISNIERGNSVLNYDKLTYAANTNNLSVYSNNAIICILVLINSIITECFYMG